MRLMHPNHVRRLHPVPVTRAQVEDYRIPPRRLQASLNRYAGVLMVTDDWLELPIGGEWIAAYRLGHSNGQTQILELRVFPDDAGPREPGEWSAQIRGSHAQHPRQAFSFGRIHKNITERSFNSALAAIAADPVRQRGLAEFGSLGRVGGRHVGSRQEGRGAGRKPRPDRFYAGIALEYDRIEHVIQPGGSTRARLAQRHRVSENTVGKWLQKARQLNLLTPALPGQRGSRATPLARARFKGQATG